MKQVLLVEDEKNIYEPLLSLLKGEGFELHHCMNIGSAKDRLKVQLPDLIILDWGLPDGQGVDLLKELRSGGYQKPVIMLTARNQVVDKVLGLESGANDYVTKPFEPRELVARVRAHLRTQSSKSDRNQEVLEHGEIQLNSTDRTVQFAGNPISLKKLEFDLLKLFLENPGRVFTRNEILNQVWGLENYPTTRTVDNHILQLRKKIVDDLFETVRGVGYRIKKAA